MTWWLLILLWGTGGEPDLMGVFRSEQACWQHVRKEQDEWIGVKNIKCVPVKE